MVRLSLRLLDRYSSNLDFGITIFSAKHKSGKADTIADIMFAHATLPWLYFTTSDFYSIIHIYYMKYITYSIEYRLAIVLY